MKKDWREKLMDYEIMMKGNVKIGQMAPEFEAETTMGNIRLSDYAGNWVVLFSHPRRFYPGVGCNIGIFFKA